MQPSSYWDSLLRPDVEQSPAFVADFYAGLRAEKLTFGDRVHCPFLRPFFVDARDEARIRPVVETIAALGERVAAAAVEDPALGDAVALTDAERRLVAIDPGYGTASTASRLDAFLLPDSLQFAEYNAESPAGLGYSETLADVFARLAVMRRFERRFEVRAFPLSSTMLDGLLESYREWGGRASPPTIAIVDWRTVPTWSEFEILRARFERRGVPTIVCDPRELVFDGRTLTAGGRRIDLVYRRVLINDIVARPEECAAFVGAYTAGAVCVANTFRCKVPHKKAFFAVLTDSRWAWLFSPEEREVVARHVPWTRLLVRGRTEYHGDTVDLARLARERRERLVIKPNDEYGGAGVVLGWETDESAWDAALARAFDGESGAWIVQERIAIRREPFPQIQGEGDAVTVAQREMLIDLAPYIFRGRLAGFLTRLSGSGLANVTSGGGQVPAFVVSERPSTSAGVSDPA
jgi:hypothetical protein